jgi:squalene synthase HpnC
VTVGHYENFPVASRLVPKGLRSAVVAIYRYARAADDLADEGDATPAERLAALDRFAAALDDIAKGGTPVEPPFPDLARAIRDHGLPMAPFRDLLSAFRQDVTTTRYADYAEVLGYCRRSANPVGRLLLALYRVETESNREYSDAICSGLQLANFWQDIAVDWRKDRVYLPGEDLVRFGVSDSQIAEERCDANWRALLAFQTERTRALLDAGRPLCAALPWRLGLELAAVIEGGARILQRIDAVDGDVFRHRPQLRRRDWWVIGGRALLAFRTRLAPAT